MTRSFAFAAVILSIVLLSLTYGGAYVPLAQASAPVQVIVNGQALKLEQSPPYKNRSAVMLPLRETAEALKYTVAYSAESGTVSLSKPSASIAYLPASNEWITEHGREKLSQPSAETRAGRLYVPLEFFRAAGWAASYEPELKQVQIYAPEVLAGAVTGLLAAGQEEELHSRYWIGRSAPEAMLPGLEAEWKALTAAGGYYLGLKKTDIVPGASGTTIRSTVSFAHGEGLLTLTLDESGHLTAIQLQASAVEEE